MTMIMMILMTMMLIVIEILVGRDHDDGQVRTKLN